MHYRDRVRRCMRPEQSSGALAKAVAAAGDLLHAALDNPDPLLERQNLRNARAGEHRAPNSARVSISEPLRYARAE